MPTLPKWRKRTWFLLAAASIPVVLGVALAVLILLQPTTPPTPSPADLAGLAEAFGAPQEPPAYPYQDFERTSVYVPGHDGTRIAVDLYLPEPLPAGRRIPAIISATRYWRRWEVRPPLSWLRKGDRFLRMFTGAGYAVVKVDARGSGASFGTRSHPWSRDEVEDYRAIIDWIVDRPWSDGAVGATGISYDGTCAEFIAYLGHPALKAAAVRFSLFDVYDHIAYPGGVFNRWFVEKWGAFNDALDAGTIPDALPSMARMVVRGPAPVEADNGEDGRALLRRALAAHAANVNVHRSAAGVEYRDQVSPLSGVSTDAFSPHATPVYGMNPPVDLPALYSLAGWFDGAYADAALERFMSYPGPHRAVVGPWNHAGGRHISPFLDPKTETEPSPLAQQLELLRFFDHNLKGKGTEPTQALRYRIMGPDGYAEWRSATAWPPRNVSTMRFFPGSAKVLAPEPPEAPSQLVYPVDFNAGSGGLNRWRTQLGRTDVVYGDMREDDVSRLEFLTSPLEAEMTIAGRPELSLRLASTADDGAVHAYLYAVSPKGEHACLTEGQVRLVHGRGPERTYTLAEADPPTPGEPFTVTFKLLSVAARLPAGYRLRLVLAGADRDQFARYPAAGDVEWTVFLDGKAHLDVPVLEDVRAASIR